jgi:hypothetical protein
VKATISAVAVGKPTTPRELFESDKFASSLATHTLHAGHVSAEQEQAMQAKLATLLKSQIHEAVVQHSQKGPAEARSLQMTIAPAKQQLAYDLMTIMFDHRTQELGGRILKSYAATPVGEDVSVTHQRIQEEHRELIQKYAKEFFPQGLKGLQEATDQDVVKAERRLLPMAARNRIGPVRSGWVVGTGVGGIGAAVIGMILTALNMLNNMGDLKGVHIPKWAIGMMATLAAGLKASSCMVQHYDRAESIVNSKFHPAGFKDFGFDLGLQMPGWLKCALFTGIAGLVAIISFVMEIVDHVKKTAR